MPLPLMQVDAFTDHPLGGNPCAVVFDADNLQPDTMQAVAQEMNLSETAFVLHSSKAGSWSVHLWVMGCGATSTEHGAHGSHCFEWTSFWPAELL